jgi:hypothetical protein
LGRVIGFEHATSIGLAMGLQPHVPVRDHADADGGRLALTGRVSGPAHHTWADISLTVTAASTDDPRARRCSINFRIRTNRIDARATCQVDARPSATSPAGHSNEACAVWLVAVICVVVPSTSLGQYSGARWFGRIGGKHEAPMALPTDTLHADAADTLIWARYVGAAPQTQHAGPMPMAA